jgi:photosystem II stability/assembly factor-like uncharacterized protein
MRCLMFTLPILKRVGLLDLVEPCLKRQNGGTTWTNDGQSQNYHFTDIHFTDSQNGWLSSRYFQFSNLSNTGVIFRTTNGGSSWIQTYTSSKEVYSLGIFNTQIGWAVGNDGIILKTTDSGSSWSNLSSGNTSTLNDVFFISPQVGWAVGGTGEPPSSAILKTTNGGVNWMDQFSGYPLLNSVYFVNSL